MKYLLISKGITIMAKVNEQNLNIQKVAEYEEKLDGVMEIIGNDLVKLMLRKVESEYQHNPGELNKVRLGIIYHEIALNLTFFYKTKKYAGYAQKSYDVLTELLEDAKTTPELLVFISCYQASSLALVSGETKKLKLLGRAFDLFEEAINKYADVSPRPEFMRGSVAENLPWFMLKKRKFAKIDFDSIIKKYEKNDSYADYKLLSFSYWAWARAHNSMKHRKQALIYLDKAIEIDPMYKAGRKRAEELKNKYIK